MTIGTEREAFEAGRKAGLAEASRLCAAEALKIAVRIPDGHGGRFAKQFARNALLATAGLIDQLRVGAVPPAQPEQPSLPQAPDSHA